MTRRRVDSVADGGHRRDNRGLAHSTHSVRMAGVGDLDDHSVDHRQVQSGGHAVVQERGVQHLALLVEEILLVQGPADALDRPTLHLSLDIAGVDRLARVLNRREPGDVRLAGVRVHGYVHEMHGIAVALSSGVHVGASRDGAAGGGQLTRQVLEGEPEFLVGFVADHAVHVFNVVFGGVPDLGGPGDHLILDILGRADGRQARGEGRPAAAGDEGVADGVGVHDRGFHVFVGYSQGFGGLLGDGGPGAANVHRAHDQADDPIEIDGHHHAGLEATVGPVAAGHAPARAPAISAAVELGLVVVMVAGGLETFDQADAPGHQTLDTAGALFGRVQQAELYGVEAQLSADLVDQRLDAEGRLGRTGGTVGGGLGFVDHHVVAVNLPVLHVVAGEGADDGLHRRRTGVGAGLHGYLRLDGRHLPVALDADLDPHPRSRGRP